jgi:tRNA nucleotidyltransferase/poly(A) polymerase
MTIPGLPSAVQGLLPALGPELVWLVGGAVRDLLLGRDTNDYDFAVQGDGLAVGRRLANTLGADYYDLDATRKTGRLLLTIAEGRRATFDFAGLRGQDILQDLERRDFTINAMAIALSRAAHPEEGTLEGVPLDPAEGGARLIDPLGGAADLRQRRLRACSPTSIADDPVRAVRAVRLALDLGLQMDHGTGEQVRRAGSSLGGLSAERLRDEFFRVLDGRDPGAALRLLDHLELFSSILPELEPLRGLAQPEPHAFDAFHHSLATVDHLARLEALLSGRSGRAEAADLAEATALARLGPYQVQIREHLDFAPSFGRPRRSLLLWGALLHDSGKPMSRAVDEAGRIRFFGHETLGSGIAVEASRRFRLSMVEQAEVEMTVLHHMRPEWLEAEGEPTRRAVYRFFRAAESAGPSVILLSLADLLARHVPPVPAAPWQRRVETAARLLRGWFEERTDIVSPPPLLTGDEIMSLRHLSPGPEVGRLVEGLREAQAAGDVSSRDEAEAFVRQWNTAD